MKTALPASTDSTFQNYALVSSCFILITSNIGCKGFLDFCALSVLSKMFIFVLRTGTDPV